MIRFFVALCLSAIHLSALAGSAPGKLACRSIDGKASLSGRVPYGEYALALTLIAGGKTTVYDDSNAIADGEPNVRKKKYALRLDPVSLGEPNDGIPPVDTPLLQLRADRGSFTSEQKSGYLRARFDALVTAADPSATSGKRSLHMHCDFRWEI